MQRSAIGASHVTELLDAKGLTRIYGRGCTSCVQETGPDRESSLCPRCGSVVALANVSLKVQPGEVLGVIGESGSGKSTLLRLLNLQEQPQNGEISYRTDDIEHRALEWNPAEQRRFRDARLSIVHQNPFLGLNFKVSAAGNVAERLVSKGCRSFSEIHERAQRLLRRSGFPVERMTESPACFSGGMQQRVQIAKALAAEPSLALLDEVTGGLDPSVQARILDLLAELQQELAMSMIVVTHDINVVRLLAHRAMVLKCGRVVEEGLSDQILEDPQHAFTQQLVSAAS